MADTTRRVLCAAVIVSMLGPGIVEGVTFDNFTALKKEWVDCGYPPAETYNETRSTYTNSFSICVEKYNADSTVKTICDLYQQEVHRFCLWSDSVDVRETADETRQLLNTSLHVCSVAKRVRLSYPMQEHLQGSRCPSACSTLGAAEVCRLLIILSLTGPRNFLNWKPTTTSSNLNPTENPTENPTQTQTQAPTQNQTQNTTQPAAQTSSVKYLLYSALVVAICVALYIIYRTRKTILTCLQEDGKTSESPEDGKGTYQKLPHFERAVPSLDAVDKVK